MGFERACSIMQCTKGFTDFSNKPSNYATDVFQPLFRQLEQLSGQTYRDIYPQPGAERALFAEDLKTAIAFRVIADHLRTLSFSIADGIMPGNNGRNYVLRRILRRAVRYGRQLGFSGDKPFFGALVATLVAQMGEVFPELVTREAVIRQTLEQEEASFNQTLDRGLVRLESAMNRHQEIWNDLNNLGQIPPGKVNELPGAFVFELYDTFGFPFDLTELILAENGWTPDMTGAEKEMEQQQERSRAAQKSTVVRALDIASEAVTGFVGFELDEVEATILEIHQQEDALFVITDKTVYYAEMGGQSGDTGVLVCNGNAIEVTGTQQIGKARAHIVASSAAVKVGDTVTLKLDTARRRPIEAHHTATHLLHWALHEVVSPDAAQQGSAVDENRLRFDFNSGAVTPEQVAAMEEMVNAAVQADEPVSWTEVPHASIKGRADIMQFFGDKYGEVVRVVQAGGAPNNLDGYSMELCGGTHVRHTGAIGLFKIKSEGAIASGVRRIEAVCGEAAWNHLNEMVEKWDHELKAASAKLHAANAKLAALGEEPVTVHEFPHIMTAMLVERANISQINAIFAHGQRTLAETRDAAIEAEKRIRKIQSSQAASLADEALAELIAKGEPIIASFEADASLLQELQNGLKKKNFTGPALLVVDDGDKLHLATHCGSAALAAGLKAGDLLRDLVAIAGGKGGGKPDQARGAAPQREKLAEIRAAAMGMLRI